MDSAIANNTAEQAAAIASRCVMNGRSVLYVPCVTDQKRRFVQAVAANEMSGQLLDIADDGANAAIDRQLIAAVGFQSGVASSRFDQIADELVGVRSRLTRYLGDLHGVSQEWGVSAYQTIQNLAQIAALPTHPTTHVRLNKQTAHSIADKIEDWAAKLQRAGELGEYTITENDTAWYKASLYSEEEAVSAYQRVVELLRKVLPATREQVASTVQTCGFPIPTTAQEWSRQVMVLKNLRRVLDVFQPEIFERDIASMIEATKPKAERKAEGTSMGFWERRRHIKEAKGLLRVGAQVENLHEALLVVSKQADQWHMFVPHGGWPVLPAKLDDIIETQENLNRDMTALNAVLATTPQGGNLETVDFNQVEERLKALYDDKQSLDILPERARLEREFHSVGLDELVEDLNNRGVANDAVAGELQLAWWTTAFEDIVKSSAIISNQDGSALQGAAERFAQVDVETCAFGRSDGGAGIHAPSVRHAVLAYAGGQSAAYHACRFPKRAVEQAAQGASADFGRGKADSGGNASHARCHHRPGAACRYRHHRYGRAYSVHRAAQHHRPREAGRGDRAPQDRHIRWPAATDRTAAKREDNRQAGSPCAEAQRLP